MAGNGNNSAKNRRERALLDLVDKSVERLEEHTDLQAPLTWLLLYYNCPDNPDRERLAAAQSLLPYLHQKTAKKVEVENTHTHTGNVTVKHQQALTQLNDMLDIKQLNDVDKGARALDVIDGEIVE